MDEEFKKAIEIGKRNAAVVPLIENWCGHARISVEGGVGLVEQYTGLPIGMRRVTCAYERARGQTSMHLAENALDFYDRNCVGCTYRQPVRLPNLTELLRARDERRAVSASARERTSRIEAVALAERAAKIAAERETVTVAVEAGAVAEASSYAIMGVLDQLHEFDKNSTDTSRSVLTESARVVPEAFTPNVVALLRMIGEAGSELRTATALEVLSVIEPDARTTYQFALGALGRAEAIDLAAIQVGTLAPTHHDSSGADDALATRAAPVAIWMARSHRPLMEVEHPAQPEAYLALWDVAPEIMEVATRRALRNEDKHMRRAGAFAVHALLTKGHVDIAMRHLPDLLAGLPLPDDYYDEGEAAHAIAWVLGELLRKQPPDVDKALQQAIGQGGPRDRLGVLRGYISAFDRYDDNGHRLSVYDRTRRVEAQPQLDDVLRLAFQRILAVLSTLPNDHELLREAASFFADDRDRIPDALIAAAVPALLGVVAMAIEESERDSGSDIKDPRPFEVQTMERMARNTLLQNVRSHLLGAVASVARDHRDARARTDTVEAIVEMLARLPETAESLRAELVSVLGNIAGDLAIASRVMPDVYTAMASRSNLVRARAARAYADLSQQVGADNLPSLLHESFLVLLSDPYVIVHDAALHALDDADLPDRYHGIAVRTVWQIIKGHADAKHTSTLAKAIHVFLDMLRPRGGAPGPMKSTLIGLIARLQPYEADDFVRRNRAGLRGAPEYGDLVLSLLQHPETFETAYGDLLAEVRELGRDEILRIADKIVAAASVLMAREYWRVFTCLELLTEAGATAQALRLANVAVEACGNTPATYPRRLATEQVRSAIMLQIAASAGNAEEVRAAARRYRDIERAIATDNEENQDARAFRLPS